MAGIRFKNDMKNKYWKYHKPYEHLFCCNSMFFPVCVDNFYENISNSDKTKYCKHWMFLFLFWCSFRFMMSRFLFDFVRSQTRCFNQMRWSNCCSFLFSKHIWICVCSETYLCTGLYLWYRNIVSSL